MWPRSSPSSADPNNLAAEFLEQLELPRALDGLGAGRDAELAMDRLRVRLHRVERDVERACDLTERGVGREEPQHGELAVAQVAGDVPARARSAAAKADLRGLDQRR